VNLVQGDYERETVFSPDPVAQGMQWFEQGAELVHIVDLDGAREGRLCVGEPLRRLRAAGVPFEVGGGIRNLDTIKTVLNEGAMRVILGTAAHREPDLVAQAVELFPDRIVAGIDAREGRVAVRGWLELTDTDASEFAVKMAEMGASRIIYTDVLSDGLMKGPNIEVTKAVARASKIPVTASGGVSSLDDIRRLRTLEEDGVDEAIIGRALYVGAFTLPEAITAAGSLL